MLNKILDTHLEALEPIKDGSSILIGGFGDTAIPFELLESLRILNRKDLVIISNNAGTDEVGIAGLIKNKQVRKIVCSHPRPPRSHVFAEAYRTGEVELECMPQGTLAERIRAAGAGLGPFFTPTGYGTLVAEDKETRVIDGIGYVLEQPLHGDFALIKARLADRWGNLSYRWAARNFSPAMCSASKNTIVQADKIVELGDIHPEHVMTAGIFVKSVVLAGASYE